MPAAALVIVLLWLPGSVAALDLLEQDLMRDPGLFIHEERVDVSGQMTFARWIDAYSPLEIVIHESHQAGNDSLRVLEGQGTGLFAEASLEQKADGTWWLAASSQARWLVIEIRTASQETRTLTLRSLDIEEGPGLPRYDRLPDGEGGQRVHVTRYGGEGRLPGVVLPAGEERWIKLKGPGRLRIDSRVMSDVNAGGGDKSLSRGVIDWSLRVEKTFDATAEIQEFFKGIDTTPPLVSGHPGLLTQPAHVYLQIPAGLHTLKLQANRQILLTTRWLRQADIERLTGIAQRPESSIQKRSEHVNDPFEIDLDRLSQSIQSTDLQTRQQALIRSGLDPHIRDRLIAAGESWLSGTHLPGQPKRAAGWAKEHIDTFGQWVGLPFVSDPLLPVREARWYQRRVVVNRPAPRILPESMQVEFASTMPRASFLQTATGAVTFHRRDAIEGRVRILSTEAVGLNAEALDEDGAILQVFSIEPVNLLELDEHLFIRESAAFEAMQRLTARLEPDRVISQLAALGVSPYATQVRTVELKLPARSSAVRIHATGSTWLALQDRVRKLPASTQRLQLAVNSVGTPQAARDTLARLVTEGGSSNSPRFDAAVAELRGWLSVRWRIFSQRLAARPAVSAQPDTPISWQNDELGRVRLGTYLLDHSAIPEVRLDALHLLTGELERLGEDYQQEMLLRGAMLFESGPVAEAFARKLQLRLERSGDTGALNRYHVARFLTQPSNGRLLSLIDGVNQAGQTEWGRLLQGLLDDPAGAGELTPGDRGRVPVQWVAEASQSCWLRNVSNGRYLKAWLVSAEKSVLMTGEMTSGVVVTLYPSHKPGASQPLDGVLVAQHADGSVLRFPFTGNRRNGSLRGLADIQPGSAETFTLPRPGPWNLRMQRGSALVTMSQVHPEPVLTWAEGIQTVVEQAKRGNVDSWWQTELSPLSTIASQSQQSSNGSQPLTPVEQMQALVAQAITDNQPEQLVALYARAVALEQANPGDVRLNRLRMQIDPAGRWRNLDIVDESAGVARLSRPAVEESATFNRVRVALLGDPGQAQRILTPGRTITYETTADLPRRVTLKLESRRPGYIRAQDAIVVIRIGSREQRLTVTAGKAFEQVVSLPAGEQTMSIYIEQPDESAWIALAIGEADQVNSWTIQQRFHAALADEPVIVSVNGPGVLRVRQLGESLPEMRVLKPGPQRIRLPGTSLKEPTYMRLALREPGTAAPREVRSAGDPTEKLGSLGAVLEMVTYDPDYPEADLYPPGFDFPTASKVSWIGLLRFGAQKELDDTLSGDSAQRYLEWVGERRNQLDTGRDWREYQLILRKPQAGDPVVGAGLRHDHQFQRRGLSTYGAIRAYFQSGEHAVTVRAGLEQQRDLGFRASHTPEVSVFARSLSLNRAPGGTTPDQDVYTDYKASHEYGLRLGDVWRFTPQIDRRLTASAFVNTNENFSLDRFDVNLGASGFWGSVALAGTYRYRYFFEDEDRLASSSASRVALDLDWRSFDKFWRHWQIGANLVYDLDASSYAMTLSLGRQFGTGRGLKDFRPDSVRFRTLREAGFPVSQVERRTEVVQ